MKIWKNFFLSLICMTSSRGIPYGSWNSKPLKFLWYLYFLLKYGSFSIFGFLTVYIYLMKNCCQYFTDNSLDSPELRSVGICWISLTVFKIWIFQFKKFWQCALQCISNWTLKKVFCTYSVVKLLIFEINWICFFLQNGETHSFPTVFILQQSD